MQQEILNELISKLSALGEDKDELELWSKVFQDLEPSEQMALITNLQNELRQLESLNKADNENS